MSDHRDELLAAYQEIERLKERIGKLKEAILWASPCGQNWIAIEQHPSYQTIGKVMIEALTEDDKNDNT